MMASLTENCCLHTHCTTGFELGILDNKILDQLHLPGGQLWLCFSQQIKAMVFLMPWAPTLQKWCCRPSICGRYN